MVMGSLGASTSSPPAQPRKSAYRCSHRNLLVSGPDRRGAATTTVNVEVVRVDEGFDVEFTPMVEGESKIAYG